MTVLITGCASPQGSTTAATDPRATPSTPRPAKPTINAAVLRGANEYDYDVKTSIKELAATTDVVLVGTVADWNAAETEILGDIQDQYAVLKLKVDRALQGGTAATDGFAYVRLSRGAESIDAKGNPVRNPGAKSTITSVQSLAEAAPLGTRLVFLGKVLTPANAHELGSVIRNPDAGHPRGTTVLIAHPQGLLFEDSDGSLGSGVADGEPWGWFDASTPAGRQFNLLTRELAD